MAHNRDLSEALLAAELKLSKVEEYLVLTAITDIEARINKEIEAENSPAPKKEVRKLYEFN